jgi:hypothetical protein
VVRLAEGQRRAGLLGASAEVALDVGERRAPVDARLARAEQVEVRSVEDVDRDHGEEGTPARFADARVRGPS